MLRLHPDQLLQTLGRWDTGFIFASSAQGGVQPGCGHAVLHALGLSVPRLFAFSSLPPPPTQVL